MTHAHAGRHAPQADMNITPLVDVMLVLLVIFMVTAPALATRVDTALSQPGPTPIDPPVVMQLEVDAAGQWRLDGVAMTQADVATRVRAQVRAADTTLTVRAAPDAEYQQFLDAVALAQASGVTRINTDPR